MDRMPAIGESAARFDWLRPVPSSQAALGGLDAEQIWKTVRFDPAVLFLLANLLPARTTPANLDERVLELLEGDLPLGKLRDANRWEAPCPMLLEAARRRILVAEVLYPDTPSVCFAAGLMDFARALVPAENRFVDSALDQSAVWGLHLGEIQRRIARRNHWPAWLRSAVTQWMAAKPEPGLAADLKRVHAVERALARPDGAIPAGISVDEFNRLRKTLGQPTPVVSNDGWLDTVIALRAEARRAVHEEELDRADRLRLFNPSANPEDLREQKLRSLAEFAGGASHEINNPLAIISGHAQWLLNHTEEEKQQKALWTIIRQVERVHHILNDVMRFARPGEPVEEVFHPGELLETVAKEYALVAEPKRIAISVEADESLWIRADKSQLKHAVGCLVTNSLEAIQQNGSIKLVASTNEDGEVTVSVEDTGAGPHAAHMEHLFDPFFSGRSAGRGKGLGLSIAWRVGDLHGGTCRYAPKPGGPTRFEIALPPARLVPVLERKSA